MPLLHPLEFIQEQTKPILSFSLGMIIVYVSILSKDYTIFLRMLENVYAIFMS